MITELITGGLGGPALMWGPSLEGQGICLRTIAESEQPLLIEWTTDDGVLRLAAIAYETMASAYLASGFRALAPAAAKKWREEAGTDPNALHRGLEWRGRLVGRTGIHYIDWPPGEAGRRSWWETGRPGATGSRPRRWPCARCTHSANSAYVGGDLAGTEVQRRGGYREIARLTSSSTATDAGSTRSGPS